MRKATLIISSMILYGHLHAQQKDTLPHHDTAGIKTSTLKQVTVTGTKTPIQISADKTIINVDASVTNSGATVLEVLEKSPGITMDRNGNISLKGRQGVAILIDGKPVQISGTDLNNLLSGMTAAQVEQIEIIDNPSSKYDAAGNAGIINIKTKKNRQKGFNGNLSVAVGQGRYTRTVNSININRYQGKLNIFANLSFNVNQNFSDLYALRKYYSPDNTTLLALLEQPSYFKGIAPNATLKSGMDYFISKKTTVGVTFTGTAYSRKTTGTNNAIWMNATGVKDSLILTNSNNRDRLRNGAVNVNFRHSFSETKALTADLDALGYNIDNDQHFINHLDETNGYTENLTGNLPSTIKIFTGKADYSQRFGKGIRLETGWKSSGVKTNNRAAYFYDLGAGPQMDLGKSNHFLYTENIHAVYGNIEKRGDRLTLQAGLRYEATSYDADQLGNAARRDSSFSRKYQGAFPSASVGFQVDSINNISVTAGRRIDRPAFQALNPFVFVINKYTYQSGNPFFRPQYTWNMEVSHTFKEMLVTSLSYSITKDYFSQIFLSDSTGVMIYTEGNLDRMQNLGLSVSAQASPLNWWSFSAQVIVNHKKITGFLWEQRNASLTQMNLNMNHQFKFNNGWSGELSGFYSLSEQELQEITDPNGQLSAGISKQIWNNKGMVKFLVRDIFYTQAMKGNTTFQAATEYFKITRDSRSASIAFTYRFGKSERAGARKTGGAQEEIQRVNVTG